MGSQPEFPYAPLTLWARSSFDRYRSWRRNEAHSVANYDPLTDLSMATRVCQGYVLSASAEISDAFEEVDEYLSKGGTTGTLMAALSLVAWYWYATPSTLTFDRGRHASLLAPEEGTLAARCCGSIVSPGRAQHGRHRDQRHL